jgi:hypothetical protein
MEEQAIPAMPPGPAGRHLPARQYVPCRFFCCRCMSSSSTLTCPSRYHCGFAPHRCPAEADPTNERGGRHPPTPDDHLLDQYRDYVSCLRCLRYRQRVTNQPVPRSIVSLVHAALIFQDAGTKVVIAALVEVRTFQHRLLCS